MNQNTWINKSEYLYRVSPLMTIMFLGVVLLSNFSQLPDLVSAGATNLLSMPIWALFGLFMLVKCRFKFKISPVAALFYKLCILFVALTLVLSLFTDGYQLKGSMFRAFVISLIVFSIGCMSSEYIDLATIDKMEVVYILSMFVVGISICVQNLAQSDTIFFYYESKNSVSTMFLAAIVFLIFGLNELPSTRRNYVFRIVFAAFFIILMAIMRSRASLVGLAAVFLGFILDSKVKKWIRFFCIIAVIVCVVFVFLSPTAYNLIVNTILFASKSTNTFNLYQISSGRVGMIGQVFDLLLEHPFVGIGDSYTGIGDYYVDCFPIAACASYGVFVGIIFILISIYPLVASLKNWKRESEIRNLRYTVIVLAGAFFLNSLFEGIAPFGPGIKCYIMWFLFGVLCNYDANRGIVERK